MRAESRAAMVSGAKKCNSPAEHGLPSRPQQPAAGPADCQPSKPSSADSQPTKMDHPHNKTKALLAACVAGEEAQPEIGVSPDERRVWGDIFQNRHHFVDMHFC